MGRPLLLLHLADELARDELLSVDVVEDVDLQGRRGEEENLVSSREGYKVAVGSISLTCPPVLVSIFSIFPDETSPPNGRSVLLEAMDKKCDEISTLLSKRC